MSNEDRDYSLLRPFDLEAAKRGEVICGTNGEPCRFLDGPNKKGLVAVRFTKDDNFAAIHANHVCMSPICWVEGRPVYRGDVLYDRFGDRHVIENVSDSQVWFESGMWIDAHELTWAPPKVKREGWVNIYRKDEPGSQTAHLAGPYETERIANDVAGPTRLACVRIEWEEPAEVAK